jgi:hypothetical protein
MVVATMRGRLLYEPALGYDTGETELGGFAVQMVKIQIPDQPQRAAAMLEVTRRGRVDSYPDHVYMVPVPALGELKKLGVTYQELGRGGFDYAEKTLRDALTAGVASYPIDIL